MDRYEWQERKVNDWAADDPALPGLMASHDNSSSADKSKHF